MTSKSLFFNLMKEELKQKLWATAITVLMLFFLFPILTLLQLDSHAVQLEEGIIDLTDIFMKCVSLENVMLAAVTVAAAFLFALQGFSYLHAKNQIDLYHGIPVKRETLFAVKYVSGFVCFLLPLVLFSAVSFVIFAAKKVPMDGALFAAYFTMLAVTAVFFLLLYATIILAVLLTGNKAISIFAAITLLQYSLILIGMWEGMRNQFWVTNYQTQLPAIAEWLSPLVLYFTTVEKYSNLGSVQWLNFAIAVLLTVVLTVTAVLLHRKRSSESAGRAIAFPKIEPVLKVMLIVPFSLFGGMFFEIFTEVRQFNLVWYVFGVILVFVICSALLEIIFAFDIRKAFAHKRIWILNAILLLAVNLFFIFDIGGHDTYLPAKESVESMAVDLGLQDLRDVNRLDIRGNYIDEREQSLRTMVIEDYQELYAFAEQKATALKDGGRERRLWGSEDRMEDGYDGMYYETNFMTIKYHLKNGKEVYRRYEINLSEEAESIEKIYENPQYLYAVNGMSEKEVYPYASYSGIYRAGGNSGRLPLTAAQIGELGKLYQEDSVLKKLRLQKDGIPLGTILLENPVTGAERGLYLYPFCLKTIAYLQKTVGGDLVLDEKIELEDVIRVTVNKSAKRAYTYYNGYSYDSVSGYSYMPDSGEDMETEEWDITDPAQIQSILAEGIPLEYAYENRFREMAVDPNIYVMVEFKADGMHQKEKANLCFLKGELPEAVTASSQQK